MEYRTAWHESNGFWYLMKHRDGSLIKVEDSQHDLAIAQGAQDIEEEYIDISDEEAENLGID